MGNPQQEERSLHLTVEATRRQRRLQRYARVLPEMMKKVRQEKPAVKKEVSFVMFDEIVLKKN